MNARISNRNKEKELNRCSTMRETDSIPRQAIVSG